MRRWTLLCTLIIGLVILGFALLNGTLLALAVPLIVHLGAGLLYGPRELKLNARRTLSADRVSRGDPVTVHLAITNAGDALAEVAIRDRVPPRLRVATGEAEVFTALAAGETVELEYTLQGERGYYHLPGIVAETQDHFGLLPRRAELDAPARLIVLPEIIRVRRAEIRPPQTRMYAGPIPARRGGPGVAFYGVRPYEPGDPLRWINAKASARHPETLFTNEFEQERVADVGLILDARLSSDIQLEDGSLFEYSIHACASLADLFLNQGNRVGLLIYGRHLEWTFPGYGKVQRERILRALSQARPGESPVFEELEHLPTRLFSARSQLVLISPLQPRDLETLVRLRAHGYALAIISPDPIAYERKKLNRSREVELAARIVRLERELLLRKLRGTGIHVFDWNVDVPFRHAAHRALRHAPLLTRPRGPR